MGIQACFFSIRGAACAKACAKRFTITKVRRYLRLSLRPSVGYAGTVARTSSRDRSASAGRGLIGLNSIFREENSAVLRLAILTAIPSDLFGWWRSDTDMAPNQSATGGAAVTEAHSPRPLCRHRKPLKTCRETRNIGAGRVWAPCAVLCTPLRLPGRFQNALDVDLREFATLNHDPDSRSAGAAAFRDNEVAARR